MRHAMIKLSMGLGTRTIRRENSNCSCIIGTSVDCLDSTVGTGERHHDIWRKTNTQPWSLSMYCRQKGTLLSMCWMKRGKILMHISVSSVVEIAKFRIKAGELYQRKRITCAASPSRSKSNVFISFQNVWMKYCHWNPQKENGLDWIKNDLWLILVRNLNTIAEKSNREKVNALKAAVDVQLFTDNHEHGEFRIFLCSIDSTNAIKPLKCKTEINNLAIFIFRVWLLQFRSRKCFCGSFPLLHMFRFLCIPCISYYIHTAYFFDINCNHYHTKRLKFIKICIAKIQINQIQIAHKKQQHAHTYAYIACHCNGTTLWWLLLLLPFYLFVHWLAFQHSNAIHYSFHIERIYWSSRWFGSFFSHSLSLANFHIKMA